MTNGPLFEAAPIRATYGDNTLDVKMVDTSRDKLDVLDAKMDETSDLIMGLMKSNPIGLGATQVAKALKMPLLTIRPAMTILKRKGRLFDTGRRNPIGETSREALLTSYEQYADPALIGSGQLARTKEARLEELLNLKRYLNEQRTSGWGWGNSPFVLNLLTRIDNRIKDLSDATS